MRILAIGASPKKGNCYSVLSSIGEDYPDIDYKLLMLKDLNLQPCRGCYVCVLRGAEKCPQIDDRDMIVEEILAADGVIFASPVYVNHATALMKTLMERLGYEAHRPRFDGKYAMVIAVCSMFGASETNEFMSGIFTSFGFNVVSSLELQMATKSEKEQALNRRKTVEALDTFFTSIKEGRGYAPPLDQMVRFNIFKQVSALQPDHFRADYQYYKDKTEYPYGGRMAILKKALAKRVATKMVTEFLSER